MGFMDIFGGKKKEKGEPPAETPKDSQEQINMACAALLLEVAEADYADDPEETRTIISALETHLSLNYSEVQTLLEKAKEETPGATDLFPYTHLLNENLDHEDKCAILTAMWRVAFADGNIDKYEELLIRRVQDLLRLDHSDFIAAKQAARPPQN
tara:strand:+ start:2438 stop:2902 length:465 start_codon:yes stop_codon:yes gene_type:complete